MKRHQAVEQKGHHHKQSGPDEPGGEADDDGDGPRLPPQGGEHPDEQEGNKDILHRQNAI